MVYRFVIIINVVIGLHTSISAQLIYELVSPNKESSGAFGGSVADAGDVNNDGYRDIVVGAHLENPDSSENNSGRAYIFSGSTGCLLHSLQSTNETQNGYFGSSVAGAGDVNNDGFDDVIVGAYRETNSSSYQGGMAYVFSGCNGTIIHELSSPNPTNYGYFGYAVSGVGDVNGDGYDDVIVGTHYGNSATSPLYAGQAYIFSGADSQVLHFLSSPNEVEYGHFGYSVSSAGDVNNDGIDDVVVGAVREYSNDGSCLSGRAYIFDGSNGHTLYSLDSHHPTAQGNFGVSVSDAGDTNGDGFDDVVVGTWGENPNGAAYVFSGSDGHILHELHAPNPPNYGNFGHHVSGDIDANGDGYKDIIVCAEWEEVEGLTAAGRTYIISGIDGTILTTLQSPNVEAYGYFGVSASGICDLNGDDSDDVIIGAFGEAAGDRVENAGHAYIMRSFLSLYCGLQGENLILAWSPNDQAANYWIYGAPNIPFFEPGDAPGYDFRLVVLPNDTNTWSNPDGVGNPTRNWTYLVMAVSSTEQELARSNRVGECDLDLDIP